MIRDTFETNPGLCKLFKRMILDRAQSAGFRSELIDFEAQIDMKGTFKDNLRTFYREYPQLAHDSDYLRLKSPRPLTGAALEQSWRSYERDNEPAEPVLDSGANFPRLTVTYTISRESSMAQRQAPIAQATSKSATLSEDESSQSLNHRDLMKLLLDRVTAMAGENVTKMILHQIGREIGSTAFHQSRKQDPPGNLVAVLDQALSNLGLGRVVALDEIDHPTSITYVCTIDGCSLCHEQVMTSSTCAIMRGIVARWLESHIQKKAEGVDGACVSDASHLCILRVTFKK